MVIRERNFPRSNDHNKGKAAHETHKVVPAMAGDEKQVAPPQVVAGHLKDVTHRPSILGPILNASNLLLISIRPIIVMLVSIQSTLIRDIRTH